MASGGNLSGVEPKAVGTLPYACGMTTWIAFISLVTAVAAVLGAWENHRALRAARRRVDALEHLVGGADEGGAAGGRNGVAAGKEAEAGPVVVIYNPVKVTDLGALRHTVEAVSAAANLPHVEWLETSVDDPGAGQARRAVAMGASRVIAAGGDGTVRVVGGVLAGTGIPLGIVPAGTGNLLGLNLGLPAGLEEQVATAVTGRPWAIDVGWIEAVEEPADTVQTERLRRRVQKIRRRAAEIGVPEPEAGGSFSGREPFLVIGGLGFDARIMAETDSDLKRRVGWVAYVMTGLRNLRGESMRATVTLGMNAHGPAYAAESGRTGSAREAGAGQGRYRSILFANCGTLPTGLALVPDARIDDGWLDVGTMRVRGGLLGWVELARQVLVRAVGGRTRARDLASLRFRRTKSARVDTEEFEPIEADGDVLGFARSVRVSVDPSALVVMS